MNFLDLWGLEVWGGIPNFVKDNVKVSATVTIERQNDGYGNTFDSTRTTTVTYGSGRTKTYVDEVGANCKSAAYADSKDGMTLPDGDYSVTTDGLAKQDDGTYDSDSYSNVLRLQTNDPNIPKETRDSINDDWYLFHANQFKDKDEPYSGTPSSAGCPIVNGQSGQDEFMSHLGGVPRKNITVTITSKEHIKNK